MPLTGMMHGQSRPNTANAIRRSEGTQARCDTPSKLVMRVRFASPAPTRNPQVSGRSGSLTTIPEEAVRRRRARCEPDTGSLACRLAAVREPPRAAAIALARSREARWSTERHRSSGATASHSKRSQPCPCHLCPGCCPRSSQPASQRTRAASFATDAFKPGFERQLLRDRSFSSSSDLRISSIASKLAPGPSELVISPASSLPAG